MLKKTGKRRRKKKKTKKKKKEKGGKKKKKRSATRGKHEFFPTSLSPLSPPPNLSSLSLPNSF
jgi:hypothetical protein